MDYNDNDVLASYLEFHYGQNYFGVENYLNRCVEFARPYFSHTSMQRALDLGCAVGRSAFELSHYFSAVDGIDLSTRFIHMANELKEQGHLNYDMRKEGDLTEKKIADINTIANKDDRNRVTFTVGNALALSDDQCDYDFILAANLIDRLNDPVKFLCDIPNRLAKNGILLISSPYTWLESFTPKKKWLTKNNQASFTEIQKHLTKTCELIKEPVDIEFVIRETARKFQHSVAQVSVWQSRIINHKS